MKVRQQLGLLIGFITIGCFYSKAGACPSTSAPVNFEYLPYRVPTMASVRLINSETKAVRQIEDEDGIISVHMALARIHAICEETGADLDVGKNRALLSFLADRLSDFERAVANYPMDADTRKKALEKVAVFKNEVVNAKGKISEETLKHHYNAMNFVFYDYDISPTARIKEPDESQYGEPTLLNEINLPDLDKARGDDGCNVKVSTFSMGPNISDTATDGGVE